MGTLMNKAFRGATIRERTAEITKKCTWSGPEAPQEFINRLRDELALTSERKLAKFTYFMIEDTPTRLTIGYGKKLVTAFTAVVQASPSAEGHTGSWSVPQWTTADGMPIHRDKVAALREKVLDVAGSAARTVAGTAPGAAGWYPDPYGSASARDFDGTAWTEHTSPAAEPAPAQVSTPTPTPTPTAPAPAPAPTAPAGWYPDPSGAAAQRYFDGTSWTAHTS